MAAGAGAGIGNLLASYGPYIAAAATAAGTYTSAQAASDAQKRREEIINQTMADQAPRQAALNTANLEAAKIYNPQTRAQNFENQEQTSADTLNQFLAQARPNAPGIPVTGNVSQDYLTNKATSDSELAKRAANLVTLMSKVTAPGFQQQREAITGGNAALVQSGASAANLAEARGTESALSTLQPNPNADIFGRVSSELGSAYLGNYLKEAAKRKAAIPRSSASSVTSESGYT